MHENLLPLIDELERAVVTRDAQAAAAIVRQLNEHEIYSDLDNEVYDRLHALEDTLGLLLFDGLEPAVFGKLLSDDKHLHTFVVWDTLEDVAERVSAETLWVIKDYLGFPSASEYPELFAKLADSDDEKISENLIETIDRLGEAEADSGTDLSAHEKTMSAFRYIRWSPDDRGLADCVRLLAARGDMRARSACKRYLMELPWGADRQATLSLLEGMSSRQAKENPALFSKALEIHHGPAPLRTWLWAAIGDTDPEACLLGVIGDLADTNNEEDRISFIEYLGAALDQYQQSSNIVIRALEHVDTQTWSLAARGYYGSMLAELLPDTDLSRVSNSLDRATITVARSWEAVRLDHMDFGMPLALMIGMGLLVNWGLDEMMGEATRIAWLPAALFWAWIGWSLVNMRTHFSGHESIGNKIFAGTVYFALLGTALGAAVILRIG